MTMVEPWVLFGTCRFQAADQVMIDGRVSLRAVGCRGPKCVASGRGGLTFTRGVVGWTHRGRGDRGAGAGGDPVSGEAGMDLDGRTGGRRRSHVRVAFDDADVELSGDVDLDEATRLPATLHMVSPS